jgi:hypothetical protein
MYSTAVPVNEQMGKGLSQMRLARPEFGPAFEGRGVPKLKRNSVSLRKRGKWAFGMPL